jgi:Na+-driven multidrug efflux pump
VQGAAIATSMARFVEAGIVVIWSHKHSQKFEFVKGLYRTFRMPGYLVKDIIKTGTPLMLNETMWAAGMAMLSQCYSMLGLNVVAGFNITTTLFNLFNVVVIALGTAIAIIVGQRLGANQMEEARDIDNKLIAFSLFCGLGIGVLIAVTAPFFPELYNTAEEAKDIATGLMLLQALFYPQYAFITAAYFTMRSGGKTLITFLFDSVYVWCISVPIAFLLSRFTELNIYWIFTMVNVADWIKCIVAFILLKKGVWIHNIVDKD